MTTIEIDKMTGQVEYDVSLYEIVDTIERLRLIGAATVPSKCDAYYNAAERLIEIVVKRCATYRIYEDKALQGKEGG